MMIFAKTERLILRELIPTDAEGMFEMNSDPEVHLYLGNKPVKSIEQSIAEIEFIRKQYIENGIGRWAVIEKATGNFVGWSGLKLIKEITNNHVNYYDLGYRFSKRFWGKVMLQKRQWRRETMVLMN
ncbi:MULTISPECIES: GNAT family N-acetyltransferase [unclassified Pedobacter]|uniref:GNAT family N-acetyltransferase n=1 Tax=Pedobacter sp. SG908 TaxID=2587135 RepID=UPI0017BEF9BD|nr:MULTISPECIES: GNAT family N-acetyltransferase [unclassified Pedobacter]NII81438.1 RimJ/RimL family protein N-acetyltransferase [Pedobacter sp. SG908]NMN35443.1 RimJ/RimL family protein N-acetyltransferase [Pedobacter sp. SG918]